tara:strand:- start:415 stop:840 length:426 start_codon:yes stop_codon:yes gene_type:complete
MFREFLEKDLAAIFEKERINFLNSLPSFGSELGVLFVIVDEDGIKNNFRTGENYFSVVGTIEFLDDATQTSFGFFNQRMALSKYKTAGNFRLLGRESNESLSGDGGIILVKKSQKFSYRIATPYNPAIGEIEGLITNLNTN